MKRSMYGKSVFAVPLISQAVETSTPENSIIPEGWGQCLCPTNAPPHHIWCHLPSKATPWGLLPPDAAQNGLPGEHRSSPYSLP